MASAPCADQLTAILGDVRGGLSGIATDRLAGPGPRRGFLGIPRAPRLVPVAEAWHVGVLLVGTDRLFATGRIVRAHEEERRGYTAQSQRVRAEEAAAARRGGFAQGEVVHVDWSELDPAELDRSGRAGPLECRDGQVCVRWSPGAASMPLAEYLAERVRLRLAQTMLS